MERLTVVLISSIALLLAAAGAAYYARGWLFSNLPASLVDPLLRAALGIREQRDVMVPMRDGTRLATNLYYPTRLEPPYATVLLRLPYGKDAYSEARQTVIPFVRSGYVVATQDMRGRFRSEGVFAPYRGDSEDGSDTVDWLASQPWSNGKIGTIGCSALGETQVLMARQRNPHHAAMIALGAGGAIGSAGGRYGYFGVFEGGVFNLASGFGWFLHNGSKRPGATPGAHVDIGKAIRELPVAGMVRRHRSDSTDFDDFVSRPLADLYWREMGYVSDEDRFSTPALLVNTWHDQTVADTLALAELMKRNWDGVSDRVARHVIVGPGNHCDVWEAAHSGMVGDLPIGKNATQPYGEWFAAMFDYWLRGRPDRKPDLPAYRFYILGEDRWADSAEWPPSGVVFTRWYLGGTSRANSKAGGGTLNSDLPPSADRYDQFRYDPNDPVPTRGGPICCTGNPQDRAGPRNQHDVESRDDVLVFTSAPLASGLRIAGPLSAELYISSDARDTDFVV
ncbi:MAG: CocE/NonD family hydrolase, partial [Burkholderiales bacterium]